jgi:hypothetical protein
MRATDLRAWASRSLCRDIALGAGLISPASAQTAATAAAKNGGADLRRSEQAAAALGGPCALTRCGQGVLGPGTDKLLVAAPYCDVGSATGFSTRLTEKHQIVEMESGRTALQVGDGDWRCHLIVDGRKLAGARGRRAGACRSPHQRRTGRDPLLACVDAQKAASRDDEKALARIRAIARQHSRAA